MLSNLTDPHFGPQDGFYYIVEGDRGVRTREKWGQEVYGMWEKRGWEMGCPRSSREKMETNFATLGNILL